MKTRAFRMSAIVVMFAFATSCTSPRLKVISDEPVYALWVNYRPISTAAIPQTAGIVQSDKEGFIDIPKDVGTVLIVNHLFSKKKEISRHPALFRFLGYWECHTPDNISLNDCVNKNDMSRLTRFFNSSVIENRLSTEKSVFFSARDLFFNSRRNLEITIKTNNAECHLKAHE